jgi:hypothetical protein
MNRDSIFKYPLFKHWFTYYSCKGCAINQTVSRGFATAVVRVPTYVRSCGICGGQSSTVASFLRVLLFPLSVLIPPTVPHSSSIIRGWHSRPISGRRTEWTQVSLPKKLLSFHLRLGLPGTYFFHFLLLYLFIHLSQLPVMQNDPLVHWALLLLLVKCANYTYMYFQFSTSEGK